MDMVSEKIISFINWFRNKCINKCLIFIPEQTDEWNKLPIDNNDKNIDKFYINKSKQSYKFQ